MEISTLDCCRSHAPSRSAFASATERPEMIVKVTVERRSMSRWLCRRSNAAAVFMLFVTLAACSDLLNPPLPAGTQDPGTFKTESGAIARYNTAAVDAWVVLVQVARVSGSFSDELHVAELPIGGIVGDPFDERILPELAATGIRNNGSDSVNRIYTFIQHNRGLNSEALGALARYAPNKPAALRGE